MLSAVSNVINVYVRLDDFLKCFIVQGQGQVRHRPCVIKKQLGTSLARRGSVWKEQHLTWHQISLTKNKILSFSNSTDVISLWRQNWTSLKRTRQLWLISMQLSMDSTLAQLWVIYPGYRAVRMRVVLARPEVGVCVPLALGLSWHKLEQRERWRTGSH